MKSAGWLPPLLQASPQAKGAYDIVTTGWVSDLEAFSQNPSEIELNHWPLSQGHVPSV